MERKPHLEYLQAREQLMEDIDSILSEWVETNTDCFSEFSNNADAKDDLVRTLCDAVCRHFPTQAQDSIQSVWVPKSLPLDS